MLQILSLILFERIPLDQLLHNIITDDIQALSAIQLNLFVTVRTLMVWD